MTVVKTKRDDAIMPRGYAHLQRARHSAAARRLERTSGWRGEMYGAAVHGYSSPEHFGSDVGRPTDNE